MTVLIRVTTTGMMPTRRSHLCGVTDKVEAGLWLSSIKTDAVVVLIAVLPVSGAIAVDEAAALAVSVSVAVVDVDAAAAIAAIAATVEDTDVAVEVEPPPTLPFSSRERFGTRP